MTANDNKTRKWSAADVPRSKRARRCGHRRQHRHRKLIDTVDLEGGPPGIIEPRTLSKLVMCNPLV